MSDSGASSAIDECDYHLSALTVGQFRQEVEINGFQLQIIDCVCRYGFRQAPCMIWSASTGRVMPDDMRLETFINSQINADNQARRAERRRSGSPVRHNETFTLAVIVTDGMAIKRLLIEYTPAPGFVYSRR